MPGGTAADRFGGKWLFGVPVLLSSVVSLLTPAAARVHINLLITLRVLSGLGDGLMLPAVYPMIARWTAPRHHSLVVSVIFAGEDAGIIVGLLLSGVLCDFGFAGGWPSVFYVFGLAGCLFSVLWFLLCYDSPQAHPRISRAELAYWESVVDVDDAASDGRRRPTPWREILTSVPVWALSAALFADVFFYFTMAACLPLFMHDVLGVNMTKNGVLSTVPFVASLLFLPFIGVTVDSLRAPGRLSTTFVRKAACVVGCSLAGAFLVLAGFVGCSVFLVVTHMSVAVVGSCVTFTTVEVNQLDLATRHAGKIMGLTSTVGFLGAIGGPLAVGVLTYEQSTFYEWRQVFFLTAAILAIGAAAYAIFGSGERQKWADAAE